MPAVTAQQILDENGWTTGDISLANLEYLIDNAINYVNLVTGLSISNLSGAAGSKTVTVTSAQDPIIKMLAGLLVRAYLDKGPAVNVAAVNVTQITTDPHYKVFMRIVNEGINRLRGRSFVRT